MDTSPKSTPSLKASKGTGRFNLTISTDRKHASEAARAVLSTILFHRLFGSLTPHCGEVAGITYPIAVNAESEALIAEKSRDLLRQFRDSEVKSKTIYVKFYESKSKNKGWFVRQQEKSWETWQIDVIVLPPSEAQGEAGRKLVSHEINNAIMDVVITMDKQRDHIPPIVSPNPAPFPYVINIV